MNDTASHRSIIGPALVLLIVGLVVWAAIMYVLLQINGDDSNVTGTVEDSAPVLLVPNR